jgi:hypothetical protein
MERIMLFMFTTLLSLSTIAEAEVWPESKWAEATPEEAGMEDNN